MEPIPTKGYVHSSVKDVFGTPYAVKCREHLQEILNNPSPTWEFDPRFKPQDIPPFISTPNPFTEYDPQFLLAFFWSEDSDKKVDIIGASREEEWPGNPAFSSWIFENGIYKPNDIGVTCEDGWIMGAAEAKLRRRCSGLEEYMSKFADLSNEPIETEF